MQHIPCPAVGSLRTGLRVCLLLTTCILMAIAAKPTAYVGVSPQGVARYFIRPIVEGDPDEALPICKHKTFQKEDIIQSSSMWPWSGLKRLTRDVYKSVQQQRRFWARSWGVTALYGCDESTEKHFENAIHCAARHMLDPDVRQGLGQAFCNALDYFQGKDYCSVLDGYAETMHCHDEMAEAVDPKHICQQISLPDLGVKISQTCSKSSIGSSGPYALPMVDLDVLGPFIEGRTYYLLFKALERLSRWADGHLFCSIKVGMTANNTLAAGNNTPLVGAEDLEVLKGWKSRIYFYIDGKKSPRLPVAVLSQFEPSEVSPNNPADNATCSTPLAPAELRFLLLVRDVKTTQEGRLVLTNRPSRSHLLEHPGGVHAGYDAVASSISKGYLQMYFRRVLDGLKGGTTTVHITVSGMKNFGGGIATIVARDLAAYLDDVIRLDFAGKGVSFKIHGVTFGTGAVGVGSYVQDVMRRVNMRNIVMAADGLSGIPCGTAKYCDEPETQVLTGPTGSAAKEPLVAVPATYTPVAKQGLQSERVPMSGDATGEKQYLAPSVGYYVCTTKRAGLGYRYPYDGCQTSRGLRILGFTAGACVFLEVRRDYNPFSALPYKVTEKTRKSGEGVCNYVWQQGAGMKLRKIML